MSSSRLVGTYLMFFLMSACVKLANILLAKPSPMAKPRDRVGGFYKVRVQKSMDTYGGS